MNTTAPTEPLRTGDVFDALPPDPIEPFRSWFADARATGVRDPGALALATVDGAGRPSCRIVQVAEVRPEGLVFTSHSDSRKGRDIAATGRAAGVLYWRESSRQVTVAGPAYPLPAAESDAFWNARPATTHPMSVAAHQSAPLDDEQDLRARAARLGQHGGPLPRPDGFVAYLLMPDEVQFWQAGADRLHRRLRYERTSGGWTVTRLQP
jgi:pyridoxamine 5'-phosphate oxidase